jgi:YHS domain-containing protein
MIIRKLIAFVFISSLSLFTSSASAESEIYTKYFSDLAVSGYDTVAYFTEGKPVKGDSDYSFEYKEATWQFSSQENLALFKTNPEKYAPQYGGYCAWAAADGRTASGDPLQWTIIDAKLYLNYNAAVQQEWLKETAKFIMEADSKWPALLN